MTIIPKNKSTKKRKSVTKKSNHTSIDCAIETRDNVQNTLDAKANDAPQKNSNVNKLHKITINSMIMKVPFHAAYWNLIVAVVGIVYLLLHGISSRSVDLNTISQDYSSLHSIQVQIAGVALLVSSLPLFVDVVANLCLGNINEMTCPRLVLSISAFIVGLQLTLQYNILNIFSSYEMSFIITFMMYRIIAVSHLAFSLNLVAGDNWHHIVFPNLLLTVVACYQGFKYDYASMDMNIFMIIFKISTMLIVLKQNYNIWKNKLSYLKILYVNVGNFGFIVQFIVTKVLDNYCSDENCLHVRNTFPLFIIYNNVIVLIILAIVPGLLSSVDSSRLKDEIITTKTNYQRYISHELRTPLNGTSQGIEFCLENIPKNTTDPIMQIIRNALVEIHASCEDGIKILSDLLLSDKNENGLMKLSYSIFNIKSFFYEYLSMFSIQLRAKNIKLELLTGDADLALLEKITEPASASLCLASDEGSMQSTTSHNVMTFRTIKCQNNIQSHNTITRQPIHDSDVLSADRSKLGQVVRNVMSNAIKFTPKHGNIKLGVVFIPDELSQRKLSSNQVEESSTSSGVLSIEIKDSGVGISIENQARLFKEIVQFDPEKLQAGGGSGLGMWISKGIVDLHGGRISVHSEGEGKGTTYRIQVPMTRDRSSVAANETTITSGNIISEKAISSTTITTSSNENPEVTTTKSTSSMGGEVRNIEVEKKSLRFLLVDDVDTNRKFLRKLLEIRGHECEEAEHGLEAVNMVKQAQNSTSTGYDVILIDFMMPTMNGPDATRAIRRLGFEGPIIGVTGNALEEDKEVFKNAGANDVAIKPLKMPVLMEMLNRIYDS